ncbi:MAG: hypothetical protein QW416_00790 [Candidatus Nitrosocaldaceae archaeon]
MKRKGIGEALTILMLLGVASVVSIIVWDQMYKQASIESIERKYELLDLVFKRLSVSNSTHTQAYFFLTLKNTGSTTFKDTNIELQYNNGTVILSMQNTTLIGVSKSITIDNIISIENTRLDEEYLLKIDAITSDGSTYGFIKKIKLSP